MNQEELQAAVDAVPYWYHRIDLPHGITTPGWAPLDPTAYRIPDDLTGKRVLDVGAWDGYWSIEASRRGAESVVAVDNFTDTLGSVTNADRNQKWVTFDLCRNAMELTDDQVMRIEADICERASLSVWDETVGDTLFAYPFNTVFMFGVLYHLRYPLKALENARYLLGDGGTIHIETAILDGCMSAYGGHGYSGDECCFEFFPGNEYGMNQSNWWVGTLCAWCGLVEAAGFRDIESWKLTDKPEHLSQSRGFIRAKV